MTQKTLVDMRSLEKGILLREILRYQNMQLFLRVLNDGIWPWHDRGVELMWTDRLDDVVCFGARLFGMTFELIPDLGLYYQENWSESDIYGHLADLLVEQFLRYREPVPDNIILGEY